MNRLDVKSKSVTKQPKQLLNVAGVARKLNVTRQNIHQQYRAGKLPTPYAITDSGHPLWRPEQIIP
jgi:hypothetical protein